MPTTRRRRSDRPRPSTALTVAVLAVCAIVVAFLLIRGEGGDGGPTPTGGAGGAAQVAAGADLVDRLVESGAVAGALTADREGAGGGRSTTEAPLTPETVESARAALGALPVRPLEDLDFDRGASFGGDWKDPDGNGCDARNDQLAAAMTRITLAADGCRVLSGVLDDPYTGERIDFVRGTDTSGAVQIDHVVALANAWRTGAEDLSPDRRADLANDPLNLQATDGPTNQGKGAKDASQWLPPDAEYRCAYVARQIAVKAVYELWVTAAERDAMTEVLAGC